MDFKTPVLFLVFNRPNKARRILDAIRAYKPDRLYFACDGPRANVEDDISKVKECRELVSCVDWDCQVFTLFRNHNLGCKLAVSSAITWFFQHEELGIIWRMIVSSIVLNSRLACWYSMNSINL